RAATVRPRPRRSMPRRSSSNPTRARASRRRDCAEKRSTRQHARPPPARSTRCGRIPPSPADRCRLGGMKRLALIALLAACATKQKAVESPADPSAAARARVDAARKSGHLEPMLHEQPVDALSYYTLGLAQFAAGNETQAAIALRKAAELRP